MHNLLHLCFSMSKGVYWLSIDRKGVVASEDEAIYENVTYGSKAFQ